MKSMLMAIMAVAVAVTFSAPAFAGDSPKEGGKDKKPGQVVETIYGDQKKEEKKGGHADTFGEQKKDEKKGGH
jgi:hypothetical protein